MRSSRARASLDMGAESRCVQAGTSRVRARLQRGWNPSWSRSWVEGGQMGSMGKKLSSKAPLSLRRRRAGRPWTPSDSPLDVRRRVPHCDTVMPSPPPSRPPANPSRVNRFQPSQAYLARTGQLPATPPVVRASTPIRDDPARSGERERRVEGGERRREESRDPRPVGAAPRDGVRQDTPPRREKLDIFTAEPHRE